MLSYLRAEFFDTYYTTATDILDVYNLRQIISFVHRTKRLELWYTMLINYDVYYATRLDLISDCYTGASQRIQDVLEVRLVPGYSYRWSDHRQHFLAHRLPWGVNGACSHPLGFLVYPPSRRRGFRKKFLVATTLFYQRQQKGNFLSPLG